MNHVVYIVRCNDKTEFIVDAVAYEDVERADEMAAEYDAGYMRGTCGPHGVYPLRVIKEDD